MTACACSAAAHTPGVIYRIKDGQAEIRTDAGDSYTVGPDKILEP